MNKRSSGGADRSSVEVPGDLFAQRAARKEAARQVEWKFEPYAAQAAIMAAPGRFKAVCCGRRWGKSLLSIVPAVEGANAAQARVLLTAPTYKTLKHGIWTHLLTQLEPRFRKVHEGDLLVELKGGGRVQCGSLDQVDNLRGQGTDLAGVVVDEAAFTSDYAVEQVLRPMLMDRGGWLLALSTPKGRRGWFHNYFLRGQSADPLDALYQSWRMPTWSNPFIQPEEVEELRHSMPTNVFDQEIGAQFIDDYGAVFRNVQLCELAQRLIDSKGLPRLIPGADYYVGIDFARSGDDYTVIVVLQKLADPSTGSGLLRLVWLDRWGRLADEEQIDRLAMIINHFKPRNALGEKNSFGAVYMSWMANRHNVRINEFVTTAGTKEPLIQQAAGAFEFHRIEIWPETEPLGGVLVNELLSYERQQTPAGHATYNAPVGYHDDCVMALALAIRAADGDPDDASLMGGHLTGKLSDWLLSNWAMPARGEGPLGGHRPLPGMLPAHW